MSAPSQSPGIELVIEKDEITEYLERFEPEELAKLLLDVVDDIGLAGEDAAQKGYAGDSFPFSKTGNLQASISYAVMRDPKVYGVVVGPQRKKGGGPLKKGWHRHLVEAGTKPHRIRTHFEVLAGVPEDQGSILHPGAKPHPWMTRSAPSIEEAGQKALDKFMERELA